jgi:predicted ATPase
VGSPFVFAIHAKHGYSPYVRGSVSNWRVYHFHDTSETAKVKQRHAANDNLQLKPDAANLAAYLRMLKEKHEAEHQRIIETIRLVLPFFDDFVHRPGDPAIRRSGDPAIRRMLNWNGRKRANPTPLSRRTCCRTAVCASFA